MRFTVDSFIRNHNQPIRKYCLLTLEIYIQNRISFHHLFYYPDSSLNHLLTFAVRFGSENETVFCNTANVSFS